LKQAADDRRLAFLYAKSCCPTPLHTRFLFIDKISFFRIISKIIFLYNPMLIGRIIMWNIRPATPNDAEGILFHTKTILETSPFMLTTPDEFMMTVERQRQWIIDQQQSGNLILVAEENRKIIGLLNTQRGKKQRLRHIVSFGISLQEAYCNQGIGSQLIQHMIEWAKKEGIEKITLNVMASNERAIHVYKKFGFQQEGYLRRQLKLEDSTYVDDIIMSLFL
jgi:RimJ/RimL family protein N-acetyltransferase